MLAVSHAALADRPAVWIGPLIFVSAMWLLMMIIVISTIIGTRAAIRAGKQPHGVSHLDILVATIVIGSLQLLLNYLRVFLGDALLLLLLGIAITIARHQTHTSPLPRGRVHRD